MVTLALCISTIVGKLKCQLINSAVIPESRFHPPPPDLSSQKGDLPKTYKVPNNSCWIEGRKKGKKKEEEEGGEKGGSTRMMKERLENGGY